MLLLSVIEPKVYTIDNPETFNSSSKKARK